MDTRTLPSEPAERVRVLTTELVDALVALAAGGRPEPEPVYDSRETARLLRVSKGTLIRLRKAGRIHPLMVGDRVLFTASELRKFIDSRNGEGES